MRRSLFVTRLLVFALCMIVVPMFEAPKLTSTSLVQAAGTPSPVFLPIIATNEVNDNIFDIAFSDSTHGWMTMGEYVEYSNEGTREVPKTVNLLTTTDGGETWTLLPKPIAYIYGLDFVSPTRGWALTKSEMLSTNDGGMSWTHVALPENTKVYRIFFFDTDNGLLFADIGWLQTNDGGQTWTPTAVSDPCPEGWESHIAPASRELGWRLCGWEGSAGSQGKELYQTKDGGATWENVGQSSSGNNGVGQPGVLPLFGYTHDIEFIDALHGWMYLLRGGMWMTADGGRSWQGAGRLDGQFLSNITPLTPTDGFVIVHRDIYHSKVMRTRDGGETWQQVYPPITPR